MKWAISALGVCLLGTALAQQIIAERNSDQEDFEQAIKAANSLSTAGRFTEALDLLEPLTGRLREKWNVSPLVAAACNNLGYLYQDLARYREAEQMYRRSIQLHRQLEGEDNPSMVKPLNNLASLYFETGRLSKAYPLFEEVLRLLQLDPNCQPSIVGTVFNNLGELDRLRHRDKEAQQNYQKALEIYRAAYGEHSTEVAAIHGNLAVLFAASGKLEEATRMLESSLVTYTNRLPDYDPIVVKGMLNLGELYRRCGRHREADNLLGKALKISEVSLGAGHPTTGWVMIARAAVLRELKQKKEAKRLARAGRSIIQRNQEENLLHHTLDVSTLVSPAN